MPVSSGSSSAMPHPARAMRLSPDVAEPSVYATAAPTERVPRVRMPKFPTAQCVSSRLPHSG
eukprot:1955020-Pyramimonas_sp.AAC.1